MKKYKKKSEVVEAFQVPESWFKPGASLERGYIGDHEVILDHKQKILKILTEDELVVRAGRLRWSCDCRRIMRMMMKHREKFRCCECNRVFAREYLLRGKHPFVEGREIRGCPTCRQCESGFRMICAERDCKADAVYNWYCRQHSEC